MSDKLLVLKNSNYLKTDVTIIQEREHSHVCETRQRNILYQQTATANATPPNQYLLSLALFACCYAAFSLSPVAEL